MCIIVANTRNVTSAFQMKAARITKNSDRKREKLKLMWHLRAESCGWKHRLCGISTQKRFSLNSERDTFAPISDNLKKNATYWSSNQESSQSLARKVCPKMVWSHRTTVWFSNSEILTVKCHWPVLRSQRMNPIRTEESCGSI